MNNNTEIIEINGQKFLILKNCPNTLATMVMLGEVKVYWIDRNYFNSTDIAEPVTNPQAIWGSCPNRFAIKI